MPQIDAIQELGQVFLPMMLNNRPEPYYFIMDTGAGMSAVEEKVAEELGLPTIGKTELAGTAGVLNVPIKQFDSVSPRRRGWPVSILTHHGLLATTQDLSAFRVPIPAPFEAGLLGNDYLRHFVVEVDFLPPNVQLSRPYGYIPAGVNPDKFLPFTLDRAKIMRVKAKLDGWMDVELRVDSGAGTLTSVMWPYVNITTSTWKQLCEKNPGYSVTGTIGAKGMGGRVELQVAKIASLDLGPLHFDLPSVVIQPEQGIFASPHAVGFISLNLFEPGGWVTFDYPAGRIYVP
ncbi:MAG: aspartyl protease family protein [Chloroflexi bacterium]|nr:aspartyl protease family protein [Chloroflexota bacterium]OJV94705.1 MAG: hypothetical protein BGO39_23585 [Chloroflexi bacterium 54-19]